MSVITLDYVNETWMRVTADAGILKTLSNYFSFEVPNAKFIKRKMGYKHWDSRIRLFKLNTRLLYRGLLPRLEQFARDRQYTIAYPSEPPIPPASNTLDAWVANAQLPFELREYQRHALTVALHARRTVILSPTGSGKSLIIYGLTQLVPGRTLIVVPTIGLVSQMLHDFAEYGYAQPITAVHGGTEKSGETQVTVSTWQSIYQQPEAYFAQFSCVIVDEVHLAKAKSLTHLMEKCTAVPYRFGLTGTLDETIQVHQLVLEGLFGQIIRVATTKQLQDAQQLSPLHIKLVVLDYPLSVKMHLRHAQYHDEIDYIVQDPARLAFIAHLVQQLQGNVLVLFNYVEKHGKQLFARIRALATHKQCHYISGEITGEVREYIRQTVNAGGEHIIVGSYGTTQLGVNMPRLNAIVLASPSRSKYRTLQSIGRVLRLHDSKSHATVIDIVDDLRHKAHVNYIFKHAEQRIAYYTQEQFPMTLKQISLDAFTRALGAS